jgi:hypothetical protein
MNNVLIALSERIVSASSLDKQAEKESFLSAISKLRKDLIDANPYLPTYDQRTSELVSLGRWPSIVTETHIDSAIKVARETT